jgi:exosortase A-associated hydrolase 1
MNFSEEALSFACGADTLLGLLARPEASASCGVLLIVGGPQYRVGSHRQFLLLSRRLAAAGIPVLRFDYRGMGDSSGDMRDFESVSDDIAAALDAFARALPKLQHFVLWGLCDAASAALLYCRERRDPRVAGLCLLNPWVRSEATLARTQVKHYYGQRLLQREFWLKLLRGQVPVVGALQSFWRSLRLSTAKVPDEASQPFQSRMAEGLQRFAGPVLIVLSGRDYTAREFVECAASNPAWAGLLAQPRLQQVEIADADHTFSRAAWRGEVERATLDWLRSAPEFA